MLFILPQNINSIISIMNKNGFSAHVVGGCVRDLITGRVPYDWDITTNATPDEVKSLFKITYDTGLKHGTVTVSYEGTLVEVTTWRKEAHYSDHRRPDHVDFTESLSEDLARRDFTMNAIAYHPKEGLIDPFGGLADIHRKTIRCVGEPVRRFSEDALRMLRAVRFSAQLGFSIEENTLAAIQELSCDLAYVSMERIQTEVNKILTSPSPERLSLIWQTRLYKTIFPEITALSQSWGDYAVRLTGLGDVKMLLLTLLFYLHLGYDAENKALMLLNRLKYDGGTVRGVVRHLWGLKEFGTFSRRNIRRLASELGDKTARNTLQLLSLLDSKKVPLQDYHTNPDSSLNSDLAPIKLNVSGLDLQNAGLCYGNGTKIMLSALFLCLYEKPELNDADTLMKLAKVTIKLPPSS